MKSTRLAGNRTRNVDLVLLFLLMTIALMGYVDLHSSANVAVTGHDKAHLIRLVVGLVAATAIGFRDYRFLERWAYIIYGGVMMLLLAVLFVGDIRNGSQRWIDLGFFDLQPSELSKLAVIIALARYFHDLGERDRLGFADLWPPALMVAFPFVLILEEPDLGTGLVVLFIALTMMAVQRISWLVIGASGIASAAAIPIMWYFVMHDYQKARVLAFMSPERHLQGDAWQVSQSIIAIGSGGLTGKGFLKGSQVQGGFVTYHETDFIFAHHAEQWGFLGSLALLGLYLALAWWSLNIARTARDRFAMLCAVGVGAFVFWHVIINIGMVTGSLPVVGLWLPLVSYGGTATVTVMAAMGLLTSISLRRHVF